MKRLGINSTEATDYFWDQVTSKVMTAPKLKDKIIQIWYCPSCHSGDPPLLNMPQSRTVADVWGSIEYAAEACNAGYRTVLSMQEPANATLGEQGTGWYLPPYPGSVGGGVWPGTWLRNPQEELAKRGCSLEAQKRLVMGGSAAAWGSDADVFDSEVWQGTVGVAERLWVGSTGGGGKGGFDVQEALPRLATHVCRMRSRGFAVAQYTPSTEALSGRTEWCTGGAPGERVQNGNACSACPAEWAWPS